MRGAELKTIHFILLAACFACTAALCLDWEHRLSSVARGADILRSQSSAGDEEGYTGREARTETGTSQKIYREGPDLKARYRFINFNRDRLTINFSMSGEDYGSYLSGYGYSDAEMAELRRWRENARQSAWKAAVPSGGRSAGEKAIAEVETEYDTRLRTLLHSRGMALRAGNMVECDMPLIVKRNIKLLNPLAAAFQKLAADKNYPEEELVGSVVSLVQTALRYQVPPPLEDGRHTGGLLPPARALLSGWGDCDTKTGVLAAILGSWSGMRMVGVAVPGHYLMAIRRLPGKGDMFVTYEGLEYVLVEPAGPAWLEPGSVGTHTADLLAGGEGYRVEPFF